MTSRSPSRTARNAPSISGAGARSDPIASTTMRGRVWLLFSSLLSDDLLATVLSTAHADAMRNTRRTAVSTRLNGGAVFARLLAPRRALMCSAGWPATSLLQCHVGLRRTALMPDHEGNFKPLSAARRGSIGFSHPQVPEFRSLPHWPHRPLQSSRHSGA